MPTARDCPARRPSARCEDVPDALQAIVNANFQEIEERSLAHNSHLPYNFSSHERWAVFTVHGEVCYICREPLNYLECEIDHIVPQFLRDAEEGFSRAIESLGLSSTFSVDSPENWSPTCRRCNRLKGERAWHPSLLVQLQLQIAKDRSAKVAELISKRVTERQLQNAFATIERAAEQGSITVEMEPEVAAALQVQLPYRAPERMNQAVRLSPRLEVLSRRGGVEVVRGPYGVGGRPEDRTADSSWMCSNCGETAWNGVRCVSCGMPSDD